MTNDILRLTRASVAGRRCHLGSQTPPRKHFTKNKKRIQIFCVDWITMGTKTHHRSNSPFPLELCALCARTLAHGLS